MCHGSEGWSNDTDIFSAPPPLEKQFTFVLEIQVFVAFLVFNSILQFDRQTAAVTVKSAFKIILVLCLSSGCKVRVLEVVSCKRIRKFHRAFGRNRNLYASDNKCCT